MALNNRKMKNQPHSPGNNNNNYCYSVYEKIRNV